MYVSHKRSRGRHYTWYSLYTLYTLTFLTLRVFWHLNIVLIYTLMLKVCQPNLLWIWLNWFWKRTISFLRIRFIYYLRAQQWVPLWPLTMQSYTLAWRSICLYSNNFINHLVLFKIYIDDGFIIYKGSASDFEAFALHFRPSIMFTYHVGTTCIFSV